jgi:hypothetical protein
MNPQDNNQQPNQSYQPTQSPANQQPATFVPQSSQPVSQTPNLASPDNQQQKKNKLPIIIIIAVGSIFILLIVAAIIFGGNKSNNQTGDNTGGQSQSQDTVRINPVPARAVDIESINTSISQDIGSLNDDTDFPANELDDRNLGL